MSSTQCSTRPYLRNKIKEWEGYAYARQFNSLIRKVVTLFRVRLDRQQLIQAEFNIECPAVSSMIITPTQHKPPHKHHSLYSHPITSNLQRYQCTCPLQSPLSNLKPLLKIAFQADFKGQSNQIKLRLFRIYGRWKQWLL